MHDCRPYRREFFANGRYFFAEVIEILDEEKFHLRIRLEDGTEMFAKPSLGHMRAVRTKEELGYAG